ncbi:MAG TPA: tetratricopeptide repeat protein [Hyphomicrobiales bacterium]|nr:tetratricopeptide repeat protein [Hyphomicrobiales bacterium]
MGPFGIIRLAIIIGLGLGICSLPAALTYSRAETSGSKGADFITQASKAYAAGDYSEAAALIEAAFKAGLTGEVAARAILLRAQINERNGKLAGALQDYSNALWMESLQAPDRKVASEGKARVMAAMGLNGQTVSGSRPASAPPSAPVTQAPAAENSSGSSVFGLFGGLFGSSEPARPAPAPQPVEPQKNWQTASGPATDEPKAKKAASAASSQPAASPKQEKAAKPTPEKPKVTRIAANEPTSAASVSSSEGYLIIFGSVNSQEAGRSKAQQIKSKLSDILVSRNLDVEASPSGGFQIVAGPYKAKSAALALCSAIKQRGVGCQVVP